MNDKSNLGWRTCPSCKKQRDAEYMFTKGRPNCLLCENRAASFKAGTERMLARLEEVRLQSLKVSPADRYRKQLENSGQYTSQQIDAFVIRNHPEEETR